MISGGNHQTLSYIVFTSKMKQKLLIWMQQNKYRIVLFYFMRVGPFCALKSVACRSLVWNLSQFNLQEKTYFPPGTLSTCPISDHFLQYWFLHRYVSVLPQLKGCRWKMRHFRPFTLQWKSIKVITGCEGLAPGLRDALNQPAALTLAAFMWPFDRQGRAVISQIWCLTLKAGVQSISLKTFHQIHDILLYACYRNLIIWPTLIWSYKDYDVCTRPLSLSAVVQN